MTALVCLHSLAKSCGSTVLWSPAHTICRCCRAAAQVWHRRLGSWMFAKAGILMPVIFDIMTVVVYVDSSPGELWLDDNLPGHSTDAQAS